MGHIAYITSGVTGKVNAAIEMGRRLAGAGHRVTYLSPSDLSERFARADLPFVHLNGDAEIVSLSSQIDAEPRRWRRWKYRLALRSRSLHNPEPEERLKAINPDALLIDIELNYLTIATRGLHLPTALVAGWFNVIPADNLPPLHTTLVPRDSPESRTEIRRAWRRLYREKRDRRLRELFTFKGLKEGLQPVRYTTRRVGDLKALCRARGISYREVCDPKAWVIPFCHSSLPIFLYTARELDFPHTPPDRIRHLGPQINLNRKDGNADRESDTAWQRYLAERTEPARPMVYCSLGTFWGNQTSQLQRIVDAFRRMPDWDLVIGLGNRTPVDAIQDPPPNAYLMPWAPQVEVLKRATGAITHGGINTINECIALRVPLLVCSTAQVDQNGCAARVVYHGLGSTLDLSHITPDRLLAELTKVTKDSTVKDNLTRMAGVFEQYRDSEIAIEAVDALIHGNGIAEGASHR